MNDDTAEWPSWFGDDDVADWLRERLPGWDLAVRPAMMFQNGWSQVIRVQAKSPCGVVLSARRFHESESHWSACTTYGIEHRKFRCHMTPGSGVRFALSKARKIRLKRA